MDLESTVDELAPQLLRYALGRTGDLAQAEEVAQDALTALVARWRRRGPPESPAAYAFAIARRRGARAALRRRLLRPLEALLDGRSAAETSEREIGARLELKRTLQALRRLPSRDREALLVAASGEVELSEAARRAGLAPSTFRMRLLRARRRLRDILEDER